MKTRCRRTRRRRRTRRQSGKGITDAVEPVTLAIQRAFPDFQYEVTASPSDSIVEVGVYCPNEVFQSDVPSLTMTIRDHEIFVNTLASCDDPQPARAMRGTDVLKRIIAIGKELKPLGIQHIRLMDASSISFPRLLCSVSLAGYMILTSKAHHSWYNSHGFRSDQYDEEVKANTAFSQQPMGELLYMIHRYRVDQKKDPLLLFMRGQTKGKNKNKNKNKKDPEYDPDGLIREVMLTYGGEVTPDQTVEEGIRRMHRLTHQAVGITCKSPMIRFYEEAMAAALKYGIRYQTMLTYPLSA